MIYFDKHGDMVNLKMLPPFYVVQPKDKIVKVKVGDKTKLYKEVKYGE